MKATNLDYVPEPMLRAAPIRVTATANPRPTGITTSRKASDQYGAKGKKRQYPEPPTSTALEKWDREVAVFEMRKAAWSWHDISSTLGISDSSARKDFRDFIARRDNDASQKLTAFRELQTARLESLLQAVWPFANNSEGTPFNHFLKANVRAQDIITEMTEMWGLKPQAGVQSQIGQLLVDARIQTIVGLTDEEIRERIRDVGHGGSSPAPSFASGVGEAGNADPDPEPPTVIDGEFDTEA